MKMGKFLSFRITAVCTNSYVMVKAGLCESKILKRSDVFCVGFIVITKGFHEDTQDWHRFTLICNGFALIHEICIDSQWIYADFQ